MAGDPIGSLELNPFTSIIGASQLPFSRYTWPGADLGGPARYILLLARVYKNPVVVIYIT